MYSARITRNTPAAFIFLIDRSGSMDEKMSFGSSVYTKAEVVAMITNMLIRELINRCRKEDGVMDYFDIAAIGYGGRQAEMLIGTQNSFAKPSLLAMADCPVKTISRERMLPGGRTVITADELKYWIEPKAEGSTPMKGAFEKALGLAAKWCRKHSNADSYPPTVFNITDGEATDSDYEGMVEIADELKSLKTSDGNALLININISSCAGDGSLLFPSSDEELPEGRYPKMLFDMASEMPEEYAEAISAAKGGAKPPFRGIGLNTSAAGIITMMNIGSRSINKML